MQIYIYILECPVFGSKFSIECSQPFSRANTLKNKMCEVIALKVEICDSTSQKKRQFWAKNGVFQVSCGVRVLKVYDFLLF